MQETGIRRSVWVSVLGSLAALGLVLFVLRQREPKRDVAAPAPATESDVTAPAATSAKPPGTPRAGTGARAGAPPAASDAEPVPYVEGWLYGDLDLREVQAVMPDNLYWELASPTKDPEVLAAREEEKTRRNQEYGRVLAGDATEEEVNAYYDYREHLSSDFLEFAEYVKRRFGDTLSEEFNGLLDLSIQMHTGRLAQIPVDRQEAIARNAERAKIREEWQREQAEFENARR